MQDYITLYITLNITLYITIYITIYIIIYITHSLYQQSACVSDLLQVRKCLAGSPHLRKAEEIISAAEATWSEIHPIVAQAEKVPCYLISHASYRVLSCMSSCLHMLIFIV